MQLSGVRSVVIVALSAGCVSLAACSGPSPAYQRVVEHEAQTSAALAESASRLGIAAQDLLAAHAGGLLAAARERVAADLIRFVDQPDAQLILAERDQLRARLEVVPIDARAAAARSLWREHPAVIDLALNTPGFSPERVLADAASLDQLNSQIDAEPDQSINAALLSRRDELLNAYFGPRLVQDDARSATAAMSRSLAELDTQRRLALIHSSALAGDAPSQPADLRRELFAALGALGVSVDTPAAQERLRRIEAALDAISRLSTR
jgi:hypothetical protein